MLSHFLGNCSGVHLQDLMCYENGIPQHKFSCLKEFSSMNLIGEHC